MSICDIRNITLSCSARLLLCLLYFLFDCVANLVMVFKLDTCIQKFSLNITSIYITMLCRKLAMAILLGHGSACIYINGLHSLRVLVLNKVFIV